jgi:hypothetical protein
MAKNLTQCNIKISGRSQLSVHRNKSITRQAKNNESSRVLF